MSQKIVGSFVRLTPEIIDALTDQYKDNYTFTILYARTETGIRDLPNLRRVCQQKGWIVDYENLLTAPVVKLDDFDYIRMVFTYGTRVDKWLIKQDALSPTFLSRSTSNNQ